MGVQEVTGPTFILRWIKLRDANAFVTEHHRHHKATVGHVVSIGAEKDGEIVGVCIIGRPVARQIDDGKTLEVLRVCVVDGCFNACSWLLTRAKRLIQAMGCKPITYTLEREGGNSLRAAGWVPELFSDGGEWTRESRKRKAAAEPGSKIRWSVP